MQWKDDMVERMTTRIWSRFGLHTGGQDLLEYALLVALIAIVVAAAVSPVGTTLKTVFWDAIAASTGI
jgi:Flp pilus assembly pilin Flp